MSDKEAGHLLDNISNEIDGTKERKCSKCQQPCRGHIGPYGPSCTAIIHVPHIHAESKAQAKVLPQRQKVRTERSMIHYYHN